MVTQEVQPVNGTAMAAKRQQMDCSTRQSTNGRDDGGVVGPCSDRVASLGYRAV